MKMSLGRGILMLVVAGASNVLAQNQPGALPLIEWSPMRKLAVADFKGAAPSLTTEASRSSISINATWECHDGNGTFDVRAVFDPNTSWWNESIPKMWQSVDNVSLLAARDYGDAILLAHEQGHFDLTEVWARKLRSLFETLPVVCKTPAAIRQLERNVDDTQRQWQGEQKQYDNETDYGTDTVRQRAWSAKIARALQQN